MMHVLDNDSIIIDAAGRDDLAAIMEIEHASSSPWSESAFIAAFSDKNVLALAARAANRALCGYLIAITIVDELHIHNLAVHPFFRRRHIGQMLLETALDLSKQRTVKKIFLEVRSRNTAAIGLYAKMGFVTQLIRRQYYSGDGDDALVMELCLRDD
jgi:ribosomal-protein-alanine N-acetyltransferase